MLKFALLVLILASAGIAEAQGYLDRSVFLCIDRDSCRTMTAVENRYPESALFINLETIFDTVIAITVGKDWSANEQPVSFFDTCLFKHVVGDTAYFYDANNDGRRDILFVVENQSGMAIGGQIDKWILLLQSEHGKFEKRSVYQYGAPLWRRNRRNYWLSDRLVTDEKLKSQYWVKDLFELSGDRFKNVGVRFGFPRIEQFVGKIPKLTKKLKRALYEEKPGIEIEWTR
jgi:hypothetical protein